MKDVNQDDLMLSGWAIEGDLSNVSPIDIADSRPDLAIHPFKRSRGLSAASCVVPPCSRNHVTAYEDHLL